MYLKRFFFSSNRSSTVFCCVLLETPSFHYTPGIYADRYIVFAFPFVCSFVCSFVRSLVRSLFRNVRGIYVKSKFLLKFLCWCISHELMIRNHSYFNHRYPIGFALFL